MLGFLSTIGKSNSYHRNLANTILILRAFIAILQGNVTNILGKFYDPRRTENTPFVSECTLGFAWCLTHDFNH
jgi:hypothetical protein